MHQESLRHSSIAVCKSGMARHLGIVAVILVLQVDSCAKLDKDSQN